MVTESECRRLPKLELHAHLNGSMSLKTIEKLYRMQKESSLHPASLEADLKLKQPCTMEEVFKIFPLIQSLTTNKEAVKIATIDVIGEFAEDGVIYLELRSTPKMTLEMSKKEYVEAIIEGIADSSRSFSIITRLILSIDRRQSIEEAEQTVALAMNDNSGFIVGIELSGNPSIDGRKFLPLLKAAREKRLKITVHLAEVSNQLEEVEDFLHFKPDRIGHGTFLHTQEKYVNIMMQYRIPLEICLTSNVLSMTTTSMADSHLKFWREKSIPVCLCAVVEARAMFANVHPTAITAQQPIAFIVLLGDESTLCIRSINKFNKSMLELERRKIKHVFPRIPIIYQNELDCTPEIVHQTTDDKGLMDCDLSSEFHKASQIFGFDLQDLWTISEKALEMSFLDKKSEDYRLLKSTLERRNFVNDGLSAKR